MSIPGLRILTKYWKKYTLLVVVASCFVLTVRVGQTWLEDAGRDVVVDQRAVPGTNGNKTPPFISGPDVAQYKPGGVDGNPPPLPPALPAAAMGFEPDNLSVREMEMRNAKLEAELKYEKLKAEMLNRDLLIAKKEVLLQSQSVNQTKPTKKPKAPPTPTIQKADEVPVSYNETVKSLGLSIDSKPGDALEAAEDAKLKLQERRRETIKRICKENPKVTGLVRTVMKTRKDVTYCHIPGVMETFWLRVMRFVNQDYVIDPATPLDISKKDAHERPFIRVKQLKWSRLSENEKTPILGSKIFMAVQNPYMRLWDLYIDTMVLPGLWSTVGIQIEAKRKSEALLVKQGMKRKRCGKDITFEEFVLYTLETSGATYEPYNRLCDPCQLNPTYIVKTETAKDDMEKVLYHLNLDYLVNRPNYANSTIVKYLSDLVTEVMPKFSRSKAEHCVTPGDIGKSLWRALKLHGLITETALPPLVNDSMTPEIVLQTITDLYLRANLNVASQKARMMINGYKMMSTNTKEAIKKKYLMDFRMFEYSEKVDDVALGL